MLTFLFAQIDKAQTQHDIRDLWPSIFGEVLFFDAPMAVILFIMWSSVVAK